MISKYPRKIYVFKRREASLLPPEGIPAYRDIDRLEDDPYVRNPFTVRDLLNLRGSLLDSDSSLYGLAFAMDKGKRAFVYITTEYDIRIPVEYIPDEEFKNLASKELMMDQFMYPKHIKATAVAYPNYLIEPGEIFYIPYTYSFAIALRKIRIRSLILRLGRIDAEGAKLREYLNILEGIEHGVDKIIMKPILQSKSE